MLIRIFTQQVTGIKPRRNIYFNEYNLYNKQKGSLKSIKKVFVFILELRITFNIQEDDIPKPQKTIIPRIQLKKIFKCKKIQRTPQYCFREMGMSVFFFFFLLPRRVALAVKAPSPKRWTAREFPKWGIRDVGLDFFFFFFGS